jgi:hypothetical protein
VIIVTSSRHNNLVKEINYFINKHRNPQNIHLVVTTENGRWYRNVRNEVDVTSTTSKLEHADKISHEIIKKIDSSVFH